MTNFRSTTSRLALAAVTSAFLLSACNKATPSTAAPSSNLAASTNGEPVSAPPIAALPLATATHIAAAAAPETLQLARAIRVARGPHADRYRYVDRAAEYNRGFADTPPDYTVDYQGTRPWVWRANNGDYRVVEYLPRGAREYYYQSGSDQPFYVSDAQGGYAFDNGSLVGIYDPDGQALDDAYAARRAAQAAAYYDRARALYHAAQYERRQAAYAADWQARRAEDAARHAAYYEARARDAEWQTWHDRNAREETRRWDDERTRRVAYAVAIGAGLGVAAVVATRGHDGQNDGAYRSNDAGRNGFAPRPRVDSRQGYQGYPPGGGSAGQAALTQQPTALLQQQRQAVSDGRRATGNAPVSSLAASNTTIQRQRNAAADQQRAARNAQQAIADARVRAEAHAASATQRVAAAATVAQARNVAKADHVAQQANAAARSQTFAAAPAQREAASVPSPHQTKSAPDARRVAAVSGGLSSGHAADAERPQAKGAAHGRAEDAAQGRGAVATRQQSHAAVAAQRITGQAEGAKPSATPGHDKDSGAQRPQALAPEAAHATKAAQRRPPQAIVHARKAASETGEAEKGKPGEQHK